jgi:hypothetical protein
VATRSGASGLERRDLHAKLEPSGAFMMSSDRAYTDLRTDLNLSASVPSCLTASGFLDVLTDGRYGEIEDRR